MNYNYKIKAFSERLFIISLNYSPFSYVNIAEFYLVCNVKSCLRQAVMFVCLFFLWFLILFQTEADFSRHCQLSEEEEVPDKP